MSEFALYRYRVKLKIPPYQREGIVIKSDVGMGEAAPLPGFSRETLDEVIEDLRSSTFQLPSSQFARDCARVPWTPHPIPQGYELLIDPEDPMEGATHIKLKLKKLRVDEAKSLISRFPTASIRLDFNQSWKAAKVIELLKHFAPGRFDLIEEPTRDLANWEEIYRQTGHHFALDENLQCCEEFPDFVDTLILKPTLIGGFNKIQAYFTSGKRCVISSAFETEIGMQHLIRLHLENPTSGLPGLDTMKYFANTPQMEPLDVHS